MRNIKKISVLAALTAAALLSAAAVPFMQAEAAQGVTTPYACPAAKIISGAEYQIMVRLSGKYITAAGGNIEQWGKKDDTSQNWKIIDAGGGTCAFLSADHPDMAITVENGDSTDGNNFALAKYTGSDAQRFHIRQTDDAFYIQAECSGNAAMDVYDISYEDGANIDQWDYWGGEGQKFYFQPADGWYSFIAGDLDFDGVLTAKDLTLLKRGMMNGFDYNMQHIADFYDDGLHDMMGRSDGFSLSNDDAEYLAAYLTICAVPAKARGFAHFRPEQEEPIAYLFAYFQGNAPEQERLCYAVSTDGYHFNALNGGKPVWQSTAGTKCIRDPYIFKGEDGLWHLLATDMKSSLGWNSNRNLVSAKSTDLVHWFDETSIDTEHAIPGLDRAWAPQAIYDPSKDSYMVYFAVRIPGKDDRTIMYYFYSKDLKTVDTTPQILFAPANGNDAIDSDIYKYQPSPAVDPVYYMYYKNETNKRIYLAKSQSPSGPYEEIKQISEGNLGVEGPNIYRLNGEKDEWLMMSDAYGNGYYVMQKTNDLENFTTVPRDQYSFDFTPRHGYVIPITASQYTALTHAFPSNSLHTFNTGILPVSVRRNADGTFALPETVTATYSDGGRMELPVGWDVAEYAAAQNVSSAAEIHGKVFAANYQNPFITERADPFVVRGSDDYYYFTASYPAYGSVDKGYDRIVLRQSTTVAGLANAEEKTVWEAHSSGIMAKHIWAPEMHEIGGKWYIFFAAGASSDIWAIRPYVLRCSGDPMTGSWTECGQMQASAGDTDSFTSFSLDMTYFENNGHHYVIWAEIKGDSSLFMAEIDPAEPWKLISRSILLTKPEYDWEKVNHRVNEGAAVLKANGKVYVFFSASGTGSEYCVGRMEAAADADLMDTKSWTKLKEPVLTSADVPGESGPGHNSFVTDEYGNVLIVYHARPSSHDSKECGTYAADPLYDPCRHTRIRQVYFDAAGVPQINLSPESFLSEQNRSVVAYIS